MQVGTRVNTRTVSRARYEKMLQEELTRINETLTLQAKHIKLKNRLKNTNKALASPLVSYEEIRKSRKKVPSRARFRVFRELRAMGYTFPSIALAADYDHTSIMHGINRLNEEETKTSAVIIHTQLAKSLLELAA